MKCRTCKHFSPDFDPMPGEDPDDITGDCHAIDPATLPYSWRWTPREVVGVTAADPPDGTTCPHYSPAA